MILKITEMFENYHLFVLQYIIALKYTGISSSELAKWTFEAPLSCDLVPH